MTTQTTSFNGLSLEKLRLLFKYDPNTGVITKLPADLPVGYDSGRGYLRTSINNKKLLLHRLAWFLTFGKFPNADLDHINGDRKDNRLVNLREATRAENLQNQTKAKGFYWFSPVKKWKVSIKKNYKEHHIGYFDTELDARAAYMRAKKELHPFSFTNEQ